MLSEARARSLLKPFELNLTSEQMRELLTYLELLLSWNRKINLTAVRSAEECLTRHFGESLYLARWVELEGRLLDIGSGAGFPGLALKIAFPQLSITLLEPVAKKRAFLKEVARTCAMHSVEVRPQRLEEFETPSRLFDTATARAVGQLEQLVPQAARCLLPGGRLFLWISHDQAPHLRHQLIDWQQPIVVPLGPQREIWIGRRMLCG
jgi:16S rRNA (guanine527-N7)-methyltransferase